MCASYLPHKTHYITSLGVLQVWQMAPDSLSKVINECLQKVVKIKTEAKVIEQL